MKQHKLALSAAGIVALFCFGTAVAVGQAEPPPHRPQTYTGHYTGAVTPTPQQVEYSEEFWPLAAGGKPLAALVVAAGASHAERIAAEEIAARVAFLGGGDTPIIEPGEEGQADLAIVLGRPETNPLLMELLRDGPSIPDHAEGYLIHPVDRDGKRFVVCAGYDEAGAYFSAQTLVQLCRARGQAVELQRVQIEDWPVFKVRSFKVGGSWQAEEGKLSATEEMGRWAPLAKFNCYNICYTTLGRDKWIKPDEGYAEYVRRMTRHQRARGLDCMPFVNPYYLWDEHIQVSDPEDLAALAQTCRLPLEAGGGKVMLCLDDFASKPDFSGQKLYTVYNEQDREKFEDDLAKVDAHMIAELHRRLRETHPDCALFVVLPYYWSPGGAWKDEGERYLQAVGEAIPDDVVIVWTGPRVRSTRVRQSDVEYYQGLVGRKCFLWDNTMYARHSPPHFFLDDFVTEYPERFSELCWGGVHLNAGAGEAYKIGLLAVSDYLWHPEGHDPKQAMRNAIAAVAGPGLVAALIEFRDAFYAVYDTYERVWGTPEQLLARVKKLQARPMDEEDIRSLSQDLAALGELAKQIAEQCDNEGLVAEVLSKAEKHIGYLEAFQHLETLPPTEAADEANLVANGGGGQVKGTLPSEWRTYTGAGRCMLGTSEEAHSGQRSIQLTTTQWHDWGGGERSINCALVAGRSNGFTGERTSTVEPFTKYYYSFWLKGDWPEVTVDFTGWTGDGTSAGQRVSCPTRPDSFVPTDDWTRCRGSFVTGTNVKRGVLKIGISKFESEGARLGTISVDDVYVGRSGNPPETIDEAAPPQEEKKPPQPPQPTPAGDKPPDTPLPVPDRPPEESHKPQRPPTALPPARVKPE